MDLAEWVPPALAIHPLAGSCSLQFVLELLYDKPFGCDMTKLISIFGRKVRI